MTGGMSVDPDDLTPLAAREAGAEIAAYGSAVLPGAMFMVGYFEDGTPVLGVPACGIHHPRTIFDLILPRVLAGEKITGARYRQARPRRPLPGLPRVRFSGLPVRQVRLSRIARAAAKT